MEYSNLFVCLMGIGTVFFGLICIIFLTMFMSRCCRDREPAVPAVPAASTAPTTAPAAAPAEEPKRQELIAAISAALAEELGTDVNGIRILSLKKL